MQLGEKFFQEKGLKHVQLSTADGALEAAPAVSKLDQRRKLSFEIVEVCQRSIFFQNMMKHLLMLVKVCVQKADFLKHQFGLLSINLNFGSSFAAPTNPEDPRKRP
jgi:hypothetical protein